MSGKTAANSAGGKGAPQLSSAARNIFVMVSVFFLAFVLVISAFAGSFEKEGDQDNGDKETRVRTITPFGYATLVDIGTMGGTGSFTMEAGFIYKIEAGGGNGDFGVSSTGAGSNGVGGKGAVIVGWLDLTGGTDTTYNYKTTAGGAGGSATTGSSANSGKGGDSMMVYDGATLMMVAGGGGGGGSRQNVSIHNGGDGGNGGYQGGASAPGGTYYPGSGGSGPYTSFGQGGKNAAAAGGTASGTSGGESGASGATPSAGGGGGKGGNGTYAGGAGGGAGYAGGGGGGGAGAGASYGGAGGGGGSSYIISESTDFKRGDNRIKSSAEVEGAFLIVSKWVIDLTVTFDSDGGSSVGDQQVAYQGKITEPVPPTKAFYSLAGWRTSGGTMWDFDNDTVTEDMTLYAVWTEAGQWWSVTFNSNGGSSVDTQRVPNGQFAAEPAAVPDKMFHAFDGWYSDASLTTPFIFATTPITNNTTIYADWAEAGQWWSVTFNSNGGSPVGAQRVPDGQLATEPMEPARIFYSFGGWYSNASLMTPFSFTSAIYNNTVLYADWAEAGQWWDVTFESNGGSAVDAQRVPGGQQATAPSPPVRDFYSFGGWYSDAALTTPFAFTAPILGDTVIYADWAEAGQWWSVTFDTDGGSAVDAQRVPDGQFADIPEQPAKDFYMFDRWFSDATLTMPFAFAATPITSDTTLYAGWVMTGTWWTVTFESNGGSAVADQMVPDNYLATEPAAPTKQFYAFDDWYSDAALTTAFVFTSPITSDITLYAGWTEDGDWWDVTFESNGGSSVGAQRIPDGQFAERPSPPSKTFYAFGDWYSDAALTMPFSFSTTPITSDITLYARWTEDGQWWSVTYESNGGSAVMSQRVPDGQFATAPTAPSKIYFAFDDWYSDAALTTAFAFAATPIIGDTMLYAGWVEDGAWWDVTFESNGGSAVDAERVPGGLQAVEPAEPVREFYTFGGWYSDPGLTTAFAFTTPITSDTVLYAEWNEDGQWWTVTYNSNGGSAVASQRVPDGQLVTEPAAPSKAFYAFGDWYSDAALTTAFVFTTPITSDITLYAEWNEDGTWWTVTYESNEGSPVDAQRIPDGQLAAEPAAPVKEFYAFDDWYSDPGLTTVFVFTTPITSDITLYAGWTEDGDWWDVTFDTDGGSLVDAQHIPDGQFASKPSPPEKAGYLFAGWHSDPGATVMFSFASPIISDTTLYAKWVAAAVVTWSVTFETDGGSAVVSQTVPDGEYAMEPAPPVWDFHTFEGWFSDIALTSLFDFAAPITSDITLYAKWEEVPPWWDVTFETNGGSPADVQRVPDGEKIFEPSTSREFYITEGWYLDPSFAGTAWDFLNDVVTEDITLYVKWDEDPMHAWFTITVSSEADRYFTHTFDGTEPPESPFVIPASGEHDIRAAFGMVFEVTAEEKVMWTYEDTRTIGATFSETVEKDMYLTASFELPGAGDNAIDESWTLLILFLILAAFLLLFLLWSRNRPVITGTVKRDGAGAAGVEIGYTVKGKNAETASDVRYVTADANGRYRITVPMGAEVAVISFAAGGNELSGRTASFLIDKKVTEADFDL